MAASQGRQESSTHRSATTPAGIESLFQRRWTRWRSGPGAYGFGLPRRAVHAASPRVCRSCRSRWGRRVNAHRGRWRWLRAWLWRSRTRSREPRWPEPAHRLASTARSSGESAPRSSALGLRSSPATCNSGSRPRPRASATRETILIARAPGRSARPVRDRPVLDWCGALASGRRWAPRPSQGHPARPGGPADGVFGVGAALLVVALAYCRRGS